MGTTPKPLRIYVDPCLYPWPEMDALAAQGHEVHTMGLSPTDTPIEEAMRYPADEYDIIFSPKAWFMTPLHKPYLKVALALARKTKYPPKKKGKKK